MNILIKKLLLSCLRIDLASTFHISYAVCESKSDIEDYQYIIYILTIDYQYRFVYYPKGPTA